MRRLLRRTVYQRYIPCVFFRSESNRALFKSSQNDSKAWIIRDTHPDTADDYKRASRVAQRKLAEQAPGGDDTLMAVPDRSLGQVRQRVHHAAERTMGKAPNVFAAVWQASMGPSAFHRTLRSVFFYCRYLVAPVSSPATTPDPRNPSLRQIQTAIRRCGLFCYKRIH
jgi:hypothetical protein